VRYISVQDLQKNGDFSSVFQRIRTPTFAKMSKCIVLLYLFVCFVEKSKEHKHNNTDLIGVVCSLQPDVLHERRQQLLVEQQHGTFETQIAKV
jgi:hypothetical protein